MLYSLANTQNLIFKAYVMSLINHLDSGNVIHEMKNYITISRGNLELLSRFCLELNLTSEQTIFLKHKMANLLMMIERETELINRFEVSKKAL